MIYQFKKCIESYLKLIESENRELNHEFNHQKQTYHLKIIQTGKYYQILKLTFSK